MRVALGFVPGYHLEPRRLPRVSRRRGLGCGKRISPSCHPHHVQPGCHVHNMWIVLWIVSARLAAWGCEGSAQVADPDLAEVWARSLDGLADLQIQPHQRAWLKLTRPLGLLPHACSGLHLFSLLAATRLHTSLEKFRHNFTGAHIDNGLRSDNRLESVANVHTAADLHVHPVSQTALVIRSWAPRAIKEIHDARFQAISLRRALSESSQVLQTCRCPL